MPKSLAAVCTDLHQPDHPIREIRGGGMEQFYPKRKTDHLCYNKSHASQDTFFIRVRIRRKRERQGRHSFAREG